MLAAGDAQAARGACGELEEIAERWAGGMLGAMAAHARGAVDLADGDARAALVALRRAGQAWRELEAPYEAARARVLVGPGLRARSATTTPAALELEAARDGVRSGSAPRRTSPASTRSPGAPRRPTRTG